MRVRTWATAAAVLAAWSVACAGEGFWRPGMAWRPPPRPMVRPQPVAAGFVIVDGRSLASPYALGWADGQLQINGVAVAVEREADGARSWGAGAAPGPGGPWRVVGNYVHALGANCLVLVPPGQVARIVRPRKAAEILGVLLSDAPGDEKLARLADAGSEVMAASQWAELVAAFVPSPDLGPRVAELQSRLADTQPRAPAQADPRVPLVRAVGVGSMVLAALALGVLLIHRPDGSGGWRGGDASASSRRLVVRCVALLVVLNVFDLGLTLFASRSEAFLELNPLVAPLLHSPAAVAAYKLGLVLPCAAVLLALRRRRLTQLAAWWTCLFYTIVIFRWAVCDTMLLI